MRRFVTRVALIGLLVSSVSGCYTTKLYYSEAPTASGPTYHRLQHTFLWGAVSPGRVDLSKFCGDSGIKRVKSQVGGWGLLANWVTAGIWIPVTVQITCAG